METKNNATASNTSPSLWATYYEDKMRNYEEPQREGTPRGEPIGFSKIKYQSALLMTCDQDLKILSEQLCISYGLIRKWRSEEAFHNLVNQFNEEFAHIFHKELIKRAKIRKKNLDQFIMNTPILFAKNYVPSKYNPDLIEDSNKYTKRLWDAIISEMWKKDYDLNLYFEYVDVLLHNSSRSLNPMRIPFIKKIHAVVIEMLMEPELTKENRKKIVVILQEINNFM